MLTLAQAIEVTRALRTALDRLHINDCDGDEQEHIAEIEAALARMYALPGVRDVFDTEDAEFSRPLDQTMKG